MTIAQARMAMSRMSRETAAWAATLPPREAIIVTEIYHHFPTAQVVNDESEEKR